LRLAVALVLAGLAVAARAATVEGQVRHGTRGGPMPNLRVQVLGFDSEQHTVDRSTRTDANGRFRFEGLPSPAIYLVRPEGKDFTYPGTPVAFRPGEPDTAPPLELKVYDESSDPKGLRVAQIQWVIERDAGRYRVSQRARVANAERSVVRVAEDHPPLLRVALAPGHGEVSTPFDRLPAGVRIAGDGAEIRGPVFPGDEGLVIELSYDLTPAAGGALETRILAPDAVDELALYVQDFGVEIDAGALHPSRVAQQDDVFFQSFVGFDLAAQAELPLRVTPLPPVREAGTWGAIALAALIAGSLAAFAGWPVANARAAAAAQAPPEVDPAEAALRSALADLEHDYETGKLSAEDRARLERELTRAPGAAAPDAAPAAAPTPCACGRVPAPADRFCAACGNKL